MFTKKITEPTVLETTIDELLSQMKLTDPRTKQYADMADQLVKLYNLKEKEAPRRVSPDTLAIIAANLVGIAIVIGHERANVITSKAFAFLMRLK